MDALTTSINTSHYFVAIGASAGGLEAIQEFFDNMPVSNNLSFIIIQHLSSDHKSLLVELLSKHTTMAIAEANHEMPVERGFVYVIPNNKLLTVEEGRLMLSDRSQNKAPNTAINTFFSSLANEKGDQAIAIILSGTGTDGSMGAGDIKDAGGYVFVQDPVTARFDGMPNSAINAGVADYILSPELMPDEIFNLIQENPPKRKPVKKGLDESKLAVVLEMVHEHCGNDFTNYKTPTLMRRISRRMDKLEKDNFDDYFEYLKANQEECRILGREFLIGVTKFFRDTPLFNILQKDVLPELINSKAEGDMLKIWVAACSTGQEAYSLAILFDKILTNEEKNIEVRIFASDIDKEAIDIASKGTYPKVSADELDTDTVNEYFSVDGDQITIIPRIRKQIVFTAHNILKDPPFIKNDLVTCRNMLIYMNPILQEKVYNRLQFAINTNGYLVLGPSEVPHAIKSAFEEVNGKWKVYRKMINTPANVERFTNNQIQSASVKKNVVPSKESTIIRSLTDDFRDIVAEEYGYAALYIDKNFEIKAAIGDHRKYLSFPDSFVNFNILKLVPIDLSVVMNTAIRKSINTGKIVSLQNVRITVNDAVKHINFTVKPSTANTYTTVIFSEGSKKDAPVNTKSSEHPEQKQYTIKLEEDLHETRRNLQLAVESLETANEELQSSNEELLSSNEELQSSNEELQSLNEELHTLNTEHQLRNKELKELNDDLNNYFSSTHIGQVFLDASLNIRKFSPSASHIINLRDSDLGRPIHHMTTNILNENFLLEEIKSVLRSGTPFEKEIQLQNGNVYIMKVLPYIRKDKVNDGLTLTFVDITTKKELDNIVKAVFNSSSSAIITLRPVRDNKKLPDDFYITSSNHTADEFIGAGNTEYIGSSLKTVFPQLAGNNFIEKFREVIRSGKTVQFETTFSKQGRQLWYDVVLTKMMDGVAINLTNIEERKETEERLKTSYYELVTAQDSIKKLNNDLEKKVQQRTSQLTESEERFRLVANISSDAIWDWEFANNKIWWSDSFFHLFGYNANDVEEGIVFWFNHIHPDDVIAVRTSMQSILEGQTKDWTASYRFRKADGTYAHILNKSSVLQDDLAMPYRMVSSMVDVTAITMATADLEIKNAELHRVIEEFKFVTDFMPQMVWATLPDGYHDFYNKGWYDYTGLTYEQTKGEGWNPVLHPDDRERAWAIWNNSLQTGQDYEIEYRFKRYDGKYHWFLGRAIPMRDENGKILKWFGTCTDIHDQKVMNDLLEEKVDQRTAELTATNKILEERNSELLQFTAVTSHDLKEPLRKISVFGQLIQDRFSGQLPAGANPMLDKIVGSAARMTRMIDDLLNYSRLDGEMDFEQADLKELVNEVIDDLALSIQEKKARINVMQLASIDCIPSQFQRVFQNLISNSLKFSRKDEPPVITIEGEFIKGDYEEEENWLYQITYSDNGIGFDVHFAKKIFEIFQRLHPKNVYEGTGIGLAIVKKIIEKHNGVIIAEGEKLKGARFIITVPVKQAHVRAYSDAGMQQLN